MSRPVADADDDAGLMERLRMAPPGELAGSAAIFTDIVDALIFTGGDGDTWARVVVRPSGTEPKVKCYLEVGCAIADDLAAARERARTVLERLVSEVRDW
jgi:phosphomannomutase